MWDGYSTRNRFPIKPWWLEVELQWGSKFRKLYDAFFVKSLLIFIIYEVLSSNLKILFRALVKLVECAIESLGHTLSSARSISTKDIFPINLWRLEIDLLYIRTNSLKTKGFPYVSLPIAAKILMSSFFEKYYIKLSKKLL